MSRPIFALAALNVTLTASYFPQFFNRVTTYDDEGFFLASMREFLRHGSLYGDTKTRYGPFYYTLLGAFYKITGTEPTPFIGRVITLIFTSLAALLFALAVWRAASSTAFAALCEVATFVVLVRVAGNEPSHPGSLTVLLLAVLAFVLVEYAVTERTRLLVIAGFVIGALLMTKINIGIFATAALVASLAIGNSRAPVVARRLVGAAVLSLPILLAFRLLWQLAIVQLVGLTTFTMAVVLVALGADRFSGISGAARSAATGAFASLVVSTLWPLLTGTSPSALFDGVFVRALRQTEILVVPPQVSIGHVSVLLSLIAVVVVLASPRNPDHNSPRHRELANAALVLVSLWTISLAFDARYAAWLPAAAITPCLALLASVTPRVRTSLRFLVPLGVLQVLHAYPVAGSQKAWGTALIVVPCSIAAAAGAQRLDVWKSIKSWTRGVIVASLCIFIVLSSGLWPIGIWRTYLKSKPLGLPGTSLIRTNADTVVTLRQLTKAVQEHCDTFYSAPAINSLYFYSELPVPTGLLPNWPGVLTVSEQRMLAAQLAEAQASGERVCIVRFLDRAPGWQASSYGHGPLGQALATYDYQVERVGHYTVSVTPRDA